MNRWIGVSLLTILLTACDTKVAPKTLEPLPNPIREDVANIIFIMDDGWDTQYTEGYQILDKYEMKGNISVIPQLVGEEYYMTEEELEELYERGWDLLNHTKTHPDLTTLSKEEQQAEIIEASEWLEDKGFTRGVDKFIYPYGSYNPETIEILKNQGFVWARTVMDDNHHEIGYEAGTFNLITDLPVETAKKRVDQVIQEKGTLLFMSHRFGKENDGHNMFYDPALFEKLVSYVAEKRDEEKLNVVTVSEYIETGGPKPKPPPTQPVLWSTLSEDEKNNVVNGRWLTVWHETFTELDEMRWNLIDDGITYNNELQHYRPENVSVQNNTLLLTGKEETHEGKFYTSGKITTENTFEFQYGRIEFQAQTNYETGSFPAVWLYPASGKTYLPEIDIFEAVGSEYGYVYYVNHWMDGNKQRKAVGSKKLNNPTGFHHYAIEWTKDSIKWFVDGKHFYTSTEGIPQEPMFLIINLAIGGGWAGPPNETSFPMTFQIKELKIMKEVIR